MKNIIVLAALSLLAMACSHPIEIVGEGDVLSATGDRDCLLEEFHAGIEKCSKNTVLGEYMETYSAVATLFPYTMLFRSDRKSVV